MPVSTEDFIAHGTIEDAAAASEIQLRGGMRSLYYGLYHQARSLKETLPAHSHGSAKKGTHSILSGYFVNFPSDGTSASPDLAKKLRRFGIILDDLRNKRHIADYELAETVRPLDYSLHKRSTENALNLLKSILELKKAESCS